MAVPTPSGQAGTGQGGDSQIASGAPGRAGRAGALSKGYAQSLTLVWSWRPVEHKEGGAYQLIWLRSYLLLPLAQ